MSKTLNTLATLLTLALPLAGCPEDPAVTLRRLGTVRAELELEPRITAALLQVFDSVGLVEQIRIEPTPLDRPAGAPQVAYQLFALPPGPHRIVATALDTADEPAPGCTPAEQVVEVVAVEVTSIYLRPVCTPAES